jgi:hypothetical protein
MRTSWAGWLCTTTVILAAMSGSFLTRVTALRRVTTGIVVVATVALAVWNVHPSVRFALSAFAAGYVLRYAVLFFLSFPRRRGIAAWLRAQFGVARGFAVYESATAILFFVRGVTFAWLVGATSVSVAALGPVWSHTLVVAGGSLALAGTLVNVWAIRVVGLDTYYYRDLFSGDSPAELKAAGPYRFCNPMYGVGQAGAYGLALAALSPAGVVATFLNQVTMYAFNEVVEQPHLAEHRR